MHRRALGERPRRDIPDRVGNEPPLDPQRGAVERSIDLGVEIAGDVPRVATHPEDHPGEHGDGEECDGAFDCLFRASFEIADEGVEYKPAPNACDGGRTDADPHRAEVPTAVRLNEVGGDDRDDARERLGLARA